MCFLGFDSLSLDALVVLKHYCITHKENGDSRRLTFNCSNQWMSVQTAANVWCWTKGPI